MGYIAAFTCGLFIGAIIVTVESIKEMKHLKEENDDLKFDNKALDNAEYRAAQYAKIIKAMEDIYFGQGTIVDKYDAMGKVFKGEE